MVEHLKVRVYLLVWGVNSRACLRILSLSLTVEHLKVLMVEHLKVRVYLLVWGVISRACLRILDSRVCFDFVSLSSDRNQSHYICHFASN